MFYQQYPNQKISLRNQYSNQNSLVKVISSNRNFKGERSVESDKGILWATKLEYARLA